MSVVVTDDLKRGERVCLYSCVREREREKREKGSADRKKRKMARVIVKSRPGSVPGENGGVVSKRRVERAGIGRLAQVLSQGYGPWICGDGYEIRMASENGVGVRGRGEAQWQSVVDGVARAGCYGVGRENLTFTRKPFRPTIECTEVAKQRDPCDRGWHLPPLAGQTGGQERFGEGTTDSGWVCRKEVRMDSKRKERG